MKFKNPGNLALAALMMAVTMAGCAHQLQIKNLNSYYNTSLPALEKPLRIGIRSSCTDITDQQLVYGIGSSLTKYNARVTTAANLDNSNIDVVANVSVLSNYKGSGWNFLINFPGFLVWAPAWNGYVYKVSHDIHVNLTDAKTGKTINTVNLPVVLNVRHADFDRTWTEISWLEVGAIAFVGGIVFIGYDDDVTPLVQQKAGPVISDYIARQIASSLSGYKPAVKEKSTTAIITPSGGDDSVEAKLKKLGSLKEKGLISDEEYQVKRKAILKTM